MSSKKKSILIICRADLAKAPRFLMEVNALKPSYHIIAAGESFDAAKQDFEFVSLIKEYLAFHYDYPLYLRKAVSFVLTLYFKFSFARRSAGYEATIKYNFNTLKKKQFDLIIVHHLWDLPLAVKLAKYKNVKLIFNAHEYYPLEFEDNDLWMKKEHPKRMQIAKAYFRDVDACFCVGQEIAGKYKNEFNLVSIVIINSKPFYDLQPNLVKQSEKIKIIHHGVAIRARKIERMIEMMRYLDSNYELDLMLASQTDEYVNELKNAARNYPNIRFIDPVDTQDISVFTNKYDIGLFLLPPTNFNYKYALPNKFFEFIQARLAIAISPSFEMEALVKQYDLGVVADDFTPQSMAEKIKQLSAEKIMYYKNQSHKYAKELSSEKTELLIIQTVKKLLNE
jgi:hypothetical protein